MISPETIALVKERTDLVALIGETVKLTRRGRSFTGLCPFHKEKTPSFHVNPERGFFHCFGCKESGSGVDFLMKAHGMTFPEAVKELASRSGIVVDETANDEDQRRAQAARRSKEDLYAVNNAAALYYERMLGLMDRKTRHPLARHAIAELEKRGMPPASSSHPDGDDERARWVEAAQAFRLGYAPHAWDGLATFLREQGISPALAERVGLLVPRQGQSGHYDRFRHRLMFSVVDVFGRVVAFSGRALDEPTAAELGAVGEAPARELDPSRGGPPKYINSPESPIYTKGEHLFGLHQAKQTIRVDGRAVLVEGNFDVFALHARGERRAIAPLGTAFTPAQATLLKRFSPAVTILFDGDAAGRKAARASREPCREGGLDARVAVMPPGADPDDFARQHGIDALVRVIDGAKGMLEYLIDEALTGDGFGGASISEQVARVRAVAKLLASEDDPNLRSMAKLYADRLSSKLVIAGQSPTDLRQLERLIEDATNPGGAAAASAPVSRGPRDRSAPRVEDIGRAIVGAVLDFPALLDDREVEEALGTLEGDDALSVAALRQLPLGEKNVSEILAHLPHSIHSFAAGRVASPVFDRKDEAKAELLANARKLKNLILAQEKAAVVERLNRSGTTDAEAEDALLREAQRASRKRRGLT